MEIRKTDLGHKYGFTLAEVLITLGIIGVVMAITIPSLINKYRTYVLQQQFKKVYAALSVAVEKVQFDMGENVKCRYGKGNTNSHMTLRDWSECKLFYQEFAKQLNVIKTCNRNEDEGGCIPAGMYRSYDEIFAEYKNLEGEEAEENLKANCNGFGSAYKGRRTVYILQGGFLISPYGIGNAPVFMVDINGHNRPNKWGHDVFVFYLALPDKELYSNYFTLKPDLCMVVEKGGFTTKEFMERSIRGTANY